MVAPPGGGSPAKPGEGRGRDAHRGRAPSLLLALLLLVAACGDSEPAAPVDSLDIQGHRGARGLRPENTLPSFAAALDAGVTTLELDLQFAADESLIVWHDPVLGRANCEVEAEVRIATSTVGDITSVRCDRNPDRGRFPDQVAVAGDYSVLELGTLFDFVDTFGATDVRFNVETKRQPADPLGPFEQAIVDLVRERDLIERVTVQSFDHRSLWTVHEIEPAIELAALTRRGDVPDFADLAARGAAVWSPDYRTVSTGTLAAAHDAGLRVIPWTVNDPADMRRLIALGVDGLITDRPDLAVDL